MEEPHLTHTSTTPGDPNVTISSLGYNTAEAVPMTVYYRKTGEGSARPTLDDLRQGRTEKQPTADAEGVCVSACIQACAWMQGYIMFVCVHACANWV